MTWTGRVRHGCRNGKQQHWGEKNIKSVKLRGKLRAPQLARKQPGGDWVPEPSFIITISRDDGSGFA